MMADTQLALLLRWIWSISEYNLMTSIIEWALMYSSEGQQT